MPPINPTMFLVCFSFVAIALTGIFHASGIFYFALGFVASYVFFQKGYLANPTFIKYATLRFLKKEQ